MGQITSFKQRREQLLKKIDGSAAVIFGAKESLRNHDVHYPFRQESNFKYLTGFDEPDSVLVLSSRNKNRTTIFVRPKDKMKETWEGKRLGVKAAANELEVDQAYAIEELKSILPTLLTGHEQVYCNLFECQQMGIVLPAIASLQKKRGEKFLKPLGVQHLMPIVGKMRLIKDQEEIAVLKKAAAISGQGHRAAMAFASASKNEADVQALMEYTMEKEGGEGTAYTSIVAGGENALILHYTQNNSALKKGDLLLIDAGTELEGYASDVTRTFPIDGTFSPSQREMYEAVLEAQKNAINAAKVGANLDDVHQAAVEPIVKWMVEKKIMAGKVDKIVAENKHQAYYLHSTSHWLGLDVHDNCPYIDEKQNKIVLQKGMVFTIEPGLYFPSDDKNVPKEFRGLGIRIEDDILIGEHSGENLTKDIPKEVEEIEVACRQDYQEFLC